MPSLKLETSRQAQVEHIAAGIVFGINGVAPNAGNRNAAKLIAYNRADAVVGRLAISHTGTVLSVIVKLILRRGTETNRPLIDLLGCRVIDRYFVTGLISVARTRIGRERQQEMSAGREVPAIVEPTHAENRVKRGVAVAGRETATNGLAAVNLAQRCAGVVQVNF